MNNFKQAGTMNGSMVNNIAHLWDLDAELDNLDGDMYRPVKGKTKAPAEFRKKGLTKQQRRDSKNRRSMKQRSHSRTYEQGEAV